ncbi:hypothetical protein EHQ62_06950 [Leptospira jelokensis]|uniref:Uncharacterized protein n=2 Tax=Leptospira jelokensis TaxID=2484931 RepID=A0A4Z1A1K1_9LEPT|nr:hypothetical protein EHQ62_06950 [Leptospira jelokensis]
MFWISLILVSLPFVFYWLWPKNGKGSEPMGQESYNLSKGAKGSLPPFSAETVVYFDAGRSELAPNEVQKWKDSVSHYLSQSLDSVTLIGSADTTGNLAKNRRLVKERVQGIKKHLISRGVNPKMILCQYLEPIQGRTPKEREQFRSVVIQWKGYGSA